MHDLSAADQRKTKQASKHSSLAKKTMGWANGYLQNYETGCAPFYVPCFILP